MPVYSKRAYFMVVALIFLAASLLPYIFAAGAAGDELVFGGFLFNPIDGNTYLAKMQQGYSGTWLFTLPYTAEKGAGWLLFIYYLFLGHLARWSGLSLLVIYHLARLAGCIVLLAGLFRYIQRSLGSGAPARLAFLLAALGSGMGWLALPSGAYTADFWVAEAYPFLSGFATPHFSLGLGLLLFLIAPLAEPAPALPAKQSAWKALRTFLLAFCLAIISPFGVVIAGVALAWPAWKAFFPFRRDSLAALLGERLPWVLLGGLPWLIYDQAAAWRDPLLAGWDAQNLTPTPAVWDLLVAFSPLIFLAIPGAVQALRRGPEPLRQAAAWLLLGILLLYAPLGLQRRFMIGLYVPVVVLGTAFLAARIPDSRRLWLAGSVILALVLPTNLIIHLSTWQVVAAGDPNLYYTRGEAQAFTWIASQTEPESLILAAPDTGLLLPAHTGRRVIYGHPFETVNAEVEKALVEAYFATPDPAVLAERGVDYVFYGPRERRLGSTAPQGLPVVYESGGVTLYAAAP
ncbi:MAG TPA: hypothetical protein VN363_07500, partial [Anaerolineales bacterium]|nr:hypothetical protein [Anaerolineales bacterium]